MATFTVTNLLDAGAGSFRDAIFQANSTAGADEINFDNFLSGGTINLTSGELGITDTLSIKGLGSNLLTVDAGGINRIFKINDGNDSNFIDVILTGLKITGGDTSGREDGAGGGIWNSENLKLTNNNISGNFAGGDYRDFNASGGIDSVYGGGGIFNQGNLTIDNTVISNNSVSPDPRDLVLGGGVENFGSLTVTNSTISDNYAYGGAGGISNRVGSTTVVNSTIAYNSTGDGTGGGITNRDDLTVINSTIFGNLGADGLGGGIENYGDLTLTSSTISGNFANGAPGGGLQNCGTATLTSNIIAGNEGNQDINGEFSECGVLISGGNNLIGNGDGVSGLINGVNGDIVGTTANPINPLLTTLRNNGGPTQTLALLPGSPAINAGSNPLGLATDQRGFNRSIGQTDIGAYERQAVPEPSSTMGLCTLAILGFTCWRKR
ncbi:choice-of-anchor Q domain-containing protein [Merismopedia glauca]|uniref:PEP-CTERM protein-sorting domain-containing protein n=1 Tax=Merismopedia glauca CCAP 1448/3 TaxID=1296344 RepID=A0A2T1BXB6_9CYAN|nr:choice-of-anchor Q domain-containing protein [Merismopedia glauca]PSB00656.1 hypothetical protein C7B64_22370 [Merismopedia glauca CCAP 1448/3]